MSKDQLDEDPGSEYDNKRRLSFSELAEQDFRVVVVIFLDNAHRHGVSVYKQNGLFWKRIEAIESCSSSVVKARIKSKKLNCRYVDDSASRVYGGDWDGKPIPEHLINLEILARLTLENEKENRVKK